MYPFNLLSNYACILFFILPHSFQVAVVLCLDVGLTMSSSSPGEESSLDQAKKIMTKFVQRQVCATSKC